MQIFGGVLERGIFGSVGTQFHITPYFISTPTQVCYSQPCPPRKKALFNLHVCQLAEHLASAMHKTKRPSHSFALGGCFFSRKTYR
jgi:hypothetical protein